ncbi:MAG: hypothetical protein KatS3mg030_383 [Saprospiraceae bacterium]|nr:MAG: hypothetical protein KatS3mg030_383 [Saprospiraceae bacterium]
MKNTLFLVALMAIALATFGCKNEHFSRGGHTESG